MANRGKNWRTNKADFEYYATRQLEMISGDVDILSVSVDKEYEDNLRQYDRFRAWITVAEKGGHKAAAIPISVSVLFLWHSSGVSIWHALYRMASQGYEHLKSQSRLAEAWVEV